MRICLSPLAREVGACIAWSCQFELTANFSVNDPHGMMHTCGLIEGSVRLVLVPLTCGQVSIIATRCEESPTRQVDCEDRSLAQGAFDGDPAAVVLGDVPDY